MLQVLQVEDSPDDVDLFQMAVREANAPAQVSVAVDGVEAITLLTTAGREARPLRPNLILLDLNLPKMAGLELMSRLKQDPVLKRIPVIVFTVSNSPLDIHQAYSLGAACYIVKPVEFPQLVEVTRNMLRFWEGARFAPVGNR